MSDGRCVSGFQPLLPGYEHWLVKFRHHLEPRDTGRAERAYAHMAESAGLVVPQTDLIAMRLNGKGEAFFASKRFDREGDRKIHMLSLAGLLHASHREPCVEYEGTLAATRLLTQSQTEVVRMFRQMVFNVVTYNRDDHTKNFAFLYRDGSWKVSPAFDLAMSPNAGMNFHHMSAVNGESRHPTLGDVMAVADQFDIADAKHVVAEVIEAASGWKAFASLYDVGSETTSDIEERIGEMIEAMRPPTTPRPRGR
ncbi:MAG: hypothetical protein DI587_39205 [Variovorax paradoxus]|nr:MAG: hypothetical protein DI583_39205 [Variovorax paradoxus]PZP98878.1 MAG: hypothetical protein DI587_39205 [Variovorax paradoxus]